MEKKIETWKDYHRLIANEILNTENIYDTYIYELQLENKCLEERLKHLLSSNSIALFDIISPSTKRYRYDITKFDKFFANMGIEIKRKDKAIAYIQDCLEHLCPVDEIELLRILGAYVD